MDDIQLLVIYGFCAALVASAIRVYDPPVTLAVVKEMFATFVGAAIVVGLAMWGMGFDLDVLANPVVFGIIASSGAGGMAAARAALAKAAEGNPKP